MTAKLEGGEWSAARPGRTLPPGKKPVPILQEAGWTPGPVWTGGKSCPYRDSIPDCPVYSQSLYRLSYNTHTHTRTYIHTHISECVGTVYELPLLTNSTASEIFVHKSEEVWKVDWIFIIGVPAWPWLGEYVTLKKLSTIFSPNRK